MLFQALHGVAQQVSLGSHVQSDVVTFGLDPVDLLHLQKDYATTGLEHHPLQVVAAGRSTLSGGDRLTLEQADELSAELTQVALADLRLRARQRGGEALVVVRLEQVVEGGDVEGLQCVLVVGGHEYDDGHLSGADLLDDAEPVHLRHLDVQEDQVGGARPDRPDCFAPVRAFPHHLDLWIVTQQHTDPFPSDGLVVDDQGADLLHPVRPHLRRLQRRTGKAGQ